MTGQALKTDLYELTMAAAYFHRGMSGQRVTCEAFLRRLPFRRSFLVMAGLARIVDYLTTLRFTDADISYLRGLPALRGAMDDRFVDYLRGFRFTGEVWAAPEGRVVFADEPILRVTAPIIEAQIVETFLLSVLNHSIKVASKAARVVLAAGKAGVVEFGARRTHDEAAIDAARAAWIAGAMGTSLVAAGMRFGIPVYGTAAHMFTMAFARPGVSSADSERESFAAFTTVFPHRPILLVDTYDTPRGIDNAIAAAGHALGGVRLDSGDLLELAFVARRKLDAAGLTAARVFASSGLDEHEVARLVAGGAPIDTFGVGENITEPVDAPITGVIYKLVYDHAHELGVAKRSESGKATRPGVKQVHRFADHDLVALADEPPPPGSRAILEPIVEAGRPIAPLDLAAARARCAADLSALPERLRAIPVDRDAPDPEPWPVRISPRLAEETARALSI